MQIVIDIPNKAYENIVKNEYDYGDMNVIIQNGILLPKGHGRLIDVDNISFSQFFDAGDYAQARRGIYDAPTIIEADTTESEE